MPWTCLSEEAETPLVAFSLMSGLTVADCYGLKHFQQDCFGFRVPRWEILTALGVVVYLEEVGRFGLDFSLLFLATARHSVSWSTVM